MTVSQRVDHLNMHEETVCIVTTAYSVIARVHWTPGGVFVFPLFPLSMSPRATYFFLVFGRQQGDAEMLLGLLIELPTSREGKFLTGPK